jgi:hypothetical protein
MNTWKIRGKWLKASKGRRNKMQRLSNLSWQSGMAIRWGMGGCVKVLETASAKSTDSLLGPTN